MQGNKCGGCWWVKEKCCQDDFCDRCQIFLDYEKNLKSKEVLVAGKSKPPLLF